MMIKNMPIEMYVNFFTVLPSVKFVVACRDYPAFGAPGRIETNAPMTYVIHLDKCTTVAKSLHTESMTYKAKFAYLCKRLQGNVLHFWHWDEFWRNHCHL